MELSKSSSPHSHRPLSTQRVMQLVILACIPGLLALTVFFGWGSFINIVWLIALALAFETLAVKLRNRKPGFYLNDYSAVVTAVLLGLSLPPDAPWWLSLTGIFFAIIIAKHLYGGLGYNPFNPAMVAYVVLLISFPVEMTHWLTPLGVAQDIPNFTASFSSIFSLSNSSTLTSNIDAYTGATALEAFKLERGALTVAEFWQQNPLLGRWSGLGWEWVNFGFLAGGLFLLYKKILTWHIPVSIIMSLALLSMAFYDEGSSASHGSPFMHLLGGATMLGAFFIATDPVTAATTMRGKIIYGTLIGLLVYIIRVWGAYPEGMAFAVLLGNFAAPLIDHYSQPRAYGHPK